MKLFVRANFAILILSDVVRKLGTMFNCKGSSETFLWSIIHDKIFDFSS